ncbi:PilZ domain-containing protein [uncultured Desulfosarcina sp.]|uniref:PilZ domain-containing protein n=1 Tax=uncultured Desulfosarcina sp. TaxID=218289 RepID=UPI0029C81A4C|nr:PilZ domain-containing protein [uncultured Desulfosarcina sp.]
MKSEKIININKRIFERKSYQQDIFFVRGTMSVHGKCINISTGGALISNNSLVNVAVGNEILIAIPFQNKQSSIKKKSTVRWIENDRFGIQFYRRKNSREMYQRKITIFTDSIILSAMINNLSKGGANILINNNFFIRKESELHVTIPFAKRNKELTIRSVVKWIKNGQCGIQFV